MTVQRNCVRCNNPYPAIGSQKWCGECRPIRTREWTAERDRRRRQKPQFLAMRRNIWRRYAAKPETQIKIKARAKVKDLIRKGRVTRLPCEGCGATPTHAHHDDYSRPLDVRFLCSPCHSREHHQHASQP